MPYLGIYNISVKRQDASITLKYLKDSPEIVQSANLKT